MRPIRSDNGSTRRLNARLRLGLWRLDEEIVKLEERLRELRSSPAALGESEALREARLEIALAVREVGAMLTNIGWELTYPQNASAVDAGGKSA